MPSQPGSRDLYEVLGCSRDANATELKRAYYRLAKQYHPDHNPNDKAAEDKFKEASNAYQILSSEEQRARYDRHGLEGLGGAGGEGGGGFSTVEDIFSTFGDLFGDFFTGRSRTRQPTRGADLRLELTLAFHEAVWGSRRDVKVSRTATCSTCRATGSAQGGRVDGCRHCQGKGQVNHAQGFFMVQTTCPQCHGAGKVIKDPCTDCRGRGAKTESSILSLTIPPGVDDGALLRVGGKGEAVPGGTPGDLFVTLHVEDDVRFERDGTDVTSAVPISFAQAALGGEVTINTLDDGAAGTTILELAPGTQPGDVVVRRGQGIPHLDGRGRGDHHVKFTLEVPRTLTSKQEKLLREFAAACNEEGKQSKRRQTR